MRDVSDGAALVEVADLCCRGRRGTRLLGYSAIEMALRLPHEQVVRVCNRLELLGFAPKWVSILERIEGALMHVIFWGWVVWILSFAVARVQWGKP